VDYKVVSCYVLWKKRWIAMMWQLMVPNVPNHRTQITFTTYRSLDCVPVHWGCHAAAIITTQPNNH
jgi:hypothetical protein